MALDMNTNNVYYLDMTGITGDTTITLANENDLPTEEILTDWGDGTQNSELTHTYSTAGEYIVVSNLQNNTSGDNSLKDYLTKMVVYYAKAPGGLCFNYNKITEVILTKNWAEKTIEKYGQKVSMAQMFRNCPLLELPNLEPIKQFKPTYCVGVFYNCQKFTSIDLTGWDLSNCTAMNLMFAGCANLTEIKGIENLNVSKCTSFDSLFLNCSSLTSLDLSSWDTSQAGNMSYMFYNCSSLTSLDLSNFNTEKVTNMQNMFQNCYSLTSLDVSNFNTEKVTSMQSMFQDCSSLTFLDVSKFETGKVNNMNAMFGNCSSLTSLDVSSFDISQTKDMAYMFAGSSLTSLDLSSFKINQTTIISYMFRLCNNLTFLDISNFNIDDNNSIEQLFYNALHITDIGMIYCNSSTINKISESITTNTTIWYQDANLSDLTVKDNITYKKYQSTTLSLNEPIQLRSIGDIHDEINYETGEYIQRIGEIVLDGSEEWVKHGAYSTDNMEVYWTYNNFIPTKAKATEIVCDKLIVANPTVINSIRTNGEGALFIGIPYGVNIVNYIQTSPLTVQFALTEPIITKIDTTILDQNNSYKSFQQTYDEQTYVSVQSDTVVTPTSSIDYEIYSSTGTVTGTSATIENAEAGTPVSGVVYGETLLNVIQEPSEDEFVVLGDNFEEQSGTLENTVEGNIKSAILKGNTLVNLYPVQRIDKVVEENKLTDLTGQQSLKIPISNGKKAIFTFNISTPFTSTFAGFYQTLPNWNLVNFSITNGKNFIILDTTINNDDIVSFDFHIVDAIVGNYTITDMMVIEYQEGMENWDIPYFENMQSVNLYPNQTVKKITWSSGRYYTETGTLTSVNATANHKYFEDYFEVMPNHTLRVKGNNTTKYLNFYDESKTFISRATLTSTDDLVATVPSNAKYYRYSMLVNSGMTDKTVIYDEDMQINIADTSIEADYLQKMGVLRSTEKKNLFDKTKIIFDKLIDMDTGNISDDSATNITDFIKVIPNTQYTMSFNFETSMWTRCFGLTEPKHGKYITDANGASDKCYFDSASKTITFTTSPTTKYLLFSFGKGVEESFQLEQGSTITSYESYKSSILSVNEEVHLRKVDDVQDTLDLVTGELTQRTGEIVLNGSENYLVHKTGDEFMRFRLVMEYSDVKRWGKSISNNFAYNRQILNSSNDLEICNGGALYEVFIFSINKSRLSTNDVTGFKNWLSQNNTIIHYELSNNTVKTVDLSIVDQDDKPTDNLHTFDTTTHINTYAQGGGLIPFVSIPKNISYDTLLKANTQYTIKLNRTNIVEGTPLTVNLGGTELSIEDSADSFTITTPSTLVNNTLSIGGTNNKVKDVMVIEGDYVDRDLDFFEGFVSVENPIMNIYHDMDNINFYSIVKWEPGNEYSELCRLPIKGQTIWYKVYGSMWNYVKYYDKDKNYLGQETNKGMGGNYQLPNGLLKPELKSKAVYFSINKRGNPTNGGYPQLRTKNNASDNVPPTPLSEICRLMTYPQVTLRSMGDTKDEWDVVGETVTRRIGEYCIDSFSNYISNNYINEQGYIFFNTDTPLEIKPKSGDDVMVISATLPYIQFGIHARNKECIALCNNQIRVVLKASKIGETISQNSLNEYLKNNPITVIYELETPITESVRITPPNPQTSTASITIPTQLNHAEDMSDFLVWNPYKEHYVRYNYVEDGVVLDNYTWENLTDLNERQFVEFYNKRTYIDQPYHNYVASHDSKGTSKYVLIEPNQDYTVSVRFSELPTCETVKVNLGGAEVEMNVNDPHVHVTTPNTLVNNLCSISGDGLDGKVTDILVIHCLEHEGFADIDYFEGIDGIGEIVEVEGVPKSKIVMEQTNGNLLDFEPIIFNNGNYISMGWNENHRNIPLKANTSYRLKMRKSKDVTSNNGWGDMGCKLYTSELVNTRNVGIDLTTGVAKFATTDNEKYLRFYKQQSHSGNTNIYEPLELTYAHFTDNELIRPRYNDKKEILLPIQLHRINTVYDNFYYDEMKGYYRIQQSIGHKYFVGADSENWTLIERGQRVLRFRYNNADIQMKSLGEFMTNRLPNGTATSPYESCAFNGINFIVSIDKERLSSESLTAFKEWLANNNLHLYYQLASPLMIELPEYSSRIEFNTYKDEIYTFFKNCKPTVFTLAVPLDQTYRFYELEQGEGYANRVELTDERMTEEDTLYINTIYGSGIGNLIEEPNNVDTMLKPNYEGKATSHSLINGKVSTIGVHGFEPNDVTISNYNTVTKQYELTVQAQQGTNTNTKVLPIPYKFEVYEDGTKDRVYYNSQHKQWMFEGGQTLTVPYNASTGAFTNAVEVFRGLQPRSGLIGEFKVRFASGTTSARLYYSINGTTYGYTTLRDMTDGVDYYIGFFNTGGSKIDMGTKIDANAEYIKLVPINGTIPECLMINQIQNITECTYYQDKTYYYSDVVSPLLLDVYNGTTTITELNGAVIDIQNNAHNKQALIYGDTTYTVYWTYVGGEGNIKVTLGGTTQEVVATQGYVTITTSDTDLEKGLFIGGFNVTIKDLMLVKGERITDLKYFEGSRAVGTAFTDENGETMYKITLVTGSELINDKFEEIITFEDNKKHNVVVTKLLGAKPNKI